MSFAGTCRDELVRIRLHEKNLRISQLIGLTLTSGGIRLLKTPCVFYQTESLTVAKHIISLLAGDFELDSMIEQKEREGRKRPIFAVVLSGKDISRYLEESGAIVNRDDGLHILSEIPNTVFENDDTARAFLRGCFLGGGTCVDPRRSYHAEIILRSAAVAETVGSMLCGYGLKVRTTHRRERFVIYLKEGDDVTGLLALIGANAAALSLESVRAEKDMRNYINRTNNCESANIDKQVTASLKQRAAIRTITEHMPVASLPKSLREAAELRMNYPEATLSELAELAGVQRSGMNHRLSRLLELAKSLEDNP